MAERDAADTPGAATSGAELQPGRGVGTAAAAHTVAELTGTADGQRSAAVVRDTFP